MENWEGNETKESKPLVGPESQRSLRTTGDSVVAGNGNALSSKRAVVIYIGLFLAGWISNEILLSFTSRPNNPAGVLNTNMNTSVPEQIVLREKGDEAIRTINVDLAYDASQFQVGRFPTKPFFMCCIYDNYGFCLVSSVFSPPDHEMRRSGTVPISPPRR